MIKTVKRALTGLLFLLLVFGMIFVVNAASETDGKGSAQESETIAFSLGDIDKSGGVDASDARSILCSALSTRSIPPEVLPYADMDKNGKITAADARLALRTAVKLEVPGEKHSFAVTVTLTATCTSEGRLEFLCEICGDNGELIIPKNNHNYSSPQITPATCVKTGVSVSVCKDCSNRYTVTLPLVAHKWVNATSAEPKHCSVCGLIIPGWSQVNGKWYYYNESGKAVTGKKVIDGLVYRFDNNGVSQTGKTGAAPKVAVLGDSVVVSIANSSAAPEFDFYGKVSLNASTIFTKSISGSDRKVIDEIVGRNYDIVIVLIGINDTGSSITAWESSYRNLLKGVKQRVPDAVIIAHAILPVNDAKARGAGYSVTMSVIKARNEVVKSVAADEGAVYVDATNVLATENGQLPYSASGDGIHFAGTLCRTWHTWITQQIGKLKG